MAGNNFDAIVIGSGIAGGMVAGGELFLSGCANAKGPKTFFSKETIVADCCYPAGQKLFTESISQLKKLSAQKFGKEFITCTAQQRTELIRQVDEEAKQYNAKIQPAYQQK